MSAPDPRSVVRIALAFAALKHKPRDQLIPSYLLDLRSCFPLAIEGNDSREWRTYALKLEEQLATLKAQRDVDQELLSKLPVEAASASDAPPPKKKSKKNPTKDQRDPEWNWDQSRADWQRFLSSQCPSSPSLVAAHTSLKGALAFPNADLLSYASRLTDAILRTLDTVNLFLFFPMTPSLDVHAQTPSSMPSQLKPAHTESTRIALASPLLMYALQVALHALVRTAQDSTKSKRRQRSKAVPVSSDVHAHVDKVLDHVLERILLPLLRALAPLCSARLAPLISMPLRKDKAKASRPVGNGKDRAWRTALVDPPKTDVRTDVLTLIGASLEAVDALPLLNRPSGSIAGGIRDRLGLETIRELEALYAVPSPPHLPAPASSSSLQSSLQQPPTASSELQPPQPTPNLTPQSQSELQPRIQQRVVTESLAKRLERLAGTRAERVRVLATRDAGWFLASTLNLCVTPPGGSVERSGGLLRETLLNRIGKLIRSIHAPLGVSDVMTDQQPSHLNDALDNSPIFGGTGTGSRFAIDPVCQNMLLAICERAMCHLV